ncbi:hypothetical protein OGAPHI_005526 [Ogataea philodendri]|uniref:PSP proline-rich domain-containing protein n=1 Tax=Ogataea philodendri TaxID=1378263 RepID=A0A9P8NZW3_9ASCO|nr:uncharacterized protein OGAPHI_005526 [Ogataea philodendri]KAH3662277.1 hypothetical protein OGAPHI_005526 [Ogataea philodendri]
MLNRTVEPEAGKFGGEASPGETVTELRSSVACRSTPPSWAPPWWITRLGASVCERKSANDISYADPVNTVDRGDVPATLAWLKYDSNELNFGDENTLVEYALTASDRTNHSDLAVCAPISHCCVSCVNLRSIRSKVRDKSLSVLARWSSASFSSVVIFSDISETESCVLGGWSISKRRPGSLETGSLIAGALLLSLQKRELSLANGDVKPELKKESVEPEVPDSPLDVVVEEAPLGEYEEFKAVFDKFQSRNDEDQTQEEQPENTENNQIQSFEGLEGDDLPEQLSKRQFKKKYKIPLAYLKAESDKPELLEMADADSPDPRLLAYLKSQHNAILVPQHWAAAKGFLMGRRNYDRPPYQLPKFIADTGIIQMRSSMNDNESTLKQRMRERVQPRMGQLDIDFNKLYDAFFKNQTKPDMLRFGEVYFEGLESIELLGPFKVGKYRPGVMTPRLREALGMVGGKSRLPPWYEKFQKLGPPPSYPYMRIRSDGTVSFDNDQRTIVSRGEPVDRTRWGQLEEESESESEEEEEESDTEEKPNEYVPSNEDIMIDSIQETKTPIQLKSQPVQQPDTTDEGPKHLYTVLKEKKGGQTDSIYGTESLAYDLKRGPSEADAKPEQEPKRLKTQPPVKTTQEKFRF